MIDAAKTHLQQQSVDPHAIDLEADTQSRCALDPETVEDYTARYRSGLYLPPVDVFYDGARYFCGDGHHRIVAARAAEIDEIAVLIHDGGREEAALFSCAANQEHGKRRTNADKRAAVEKCMRLRPKWSNSLIAEHCGVSPTTVATVRSTLQLGESTVRQGADGRTYNTASIGKKPAMRPAVKRLEDTEEVDAAVRALAEYVSARSQKLPIDEARSWLQLEIGVQIEDDDWEEILDEGKHKSLWQLADGCLQPMTGRVYTPDEVLSTLEDMLREAGGRLGQAEGREKLSRELCALTDEQWSAVLDLGADERRVSLDLARDELVYLEDGSERAEEVPAAPPKGFDLLWRARLERLSAVLAKSHGGAGRLSQLRDTYQAAGKVSDEHWDLLVRKGATAGLWTLEGAGKGQQIRLVQATSSEADTEGDRSSEYSGREQPGDETSADEDLEDLDTDPDEGPVLPSDPDDPAVQGHRAALEEAAEDEDEEPGGVEGTTHRPHGEGVGQPSPAAEKAGSIPAPGTSAFFDQALLREREHCHEESLRARSEGLRLDLERLGGETTLAKLRRACEGPSKSLIRTDYWHAMLGYGLEANLWVIAGERIWIEKPRIAAMPPDTLPAPPPSAPLGAESDGDGDLPNDERAKNDAYYTPDLHARALVRWLSQHVYAGQDPQRILEPSVGGGAWLRACRDQWPEAHLRAADIDGDAAGLLLADRARVGDFMALDLESADLIVGNPPYGDEDLDRAAARARLVAWIDRSRELAPVVGYLMRSTFLGARDRLEWWQRRPPTDVIVVLPRPAWGGPGKRATTDRVDSLFVVWRGAVTGSTRLHWLDAREGEDLVIGADEEEG